MKQIILLVGAFFALIPQSFAAPTFWECSFRHLEKEDGWFTPPAQETGSVGFPFTAMVDTGVATFFLDSSAADRWSGAVREALLKDMDEGFLLPAEITEKGGSNYSPDTSGCVDSCSFQMCYPSCGGATECSPRCCGITGGSGGGGPTHIFAKKAAVKPILNVFDHLLQDDPVYEAHEWELKKSSVSVDYTKETTFHVPFAEAREEGQGGKKIHSLEWGCKVVDVARVKVLNPEALGVPHEKNALPPALQGEAQSY